MGVKAHHNRLRAADETEWVLNQTTKLYHKACKARQVVCWLKQPNKLFAYVTCTSSWQSPSTSADFANQLNELKTEGKLLLALDTGQNPNIHCNVDEPQIDQTFRDVLQCIADCSDVQLKAPYGVQSEFNIGAIYS